MAAAERSLSRPNFDLGSQVEGLFGRGACGNALDLVDGSSPVLITDLNLEGSGLLSTTPLDTLPRICLPPGEPTEERVWKAASELALHDSVVAIGGGSVLDTAKLAAALAGSPNCRDLGRGHSFGGHLPLVAVPTTAGSGAEVTRTAVYSSGGHKVWAWSEHLRPDRVLLDPRLTLGLPEAVTVATGLDAFVHAVEAFSGQNRSRKASSAAEFALVTVDRALPEVVHNPDSLEDRESLLAASTAAGLAIDASGTGIAHALGHALGSLLPIAHGLAVALGLWVAAPFNQKAGDSRADRVAVLLGADSYADAVRRLLESVPMFDLLQPLAKEHPLDPARLEVELMSEVNRPMRENNLRLVGAKEARVLVSDTVATWQRLGGWA